MVGKEFVNKDALKSCSDGSDFQTDCYHQEFIVPFEYPVYFTNDLLNSDNPVLEQAITRSGEEGPHRILVYIDAGLVKAQPGVVDKLEAYIKNRSGLIEMIGSPEFVPGGEHAKNGWNSVQNIMTSIGNNHVCRHSFVLAIGGGSVLDMIGFAASIVHRGIRLIRIPTTVLAQNDAGVGVKTGMDEHGMKNFVGTFAPPFAVLIDNNFLRTLDDKYWIGGISEAFKVAIIKDSSFFEYLYNNATKLKDRDEGVIREVVKRTAILHLDHIKTSGDPFEFGAARPLDFGHWSAHKLELLSNYNIGHGEAVAIGIALDSCYAHKKGWISLNELSRILQAMCNTGLVLWNNLLERRGSDGELEIVKGISEFREHLGGKLTITLPDSIGKKQEVHNIDLQLLSESIVYLKEYVKAC